MCGILACFTQKHVTAVEACFEKILTRLTHRGPDDAGIWFDRDAGIFLGHRRLSILDLSPAGHQPMTSHDGRFVIVFNGEVYNWQELREPLTQSGVRFNGHSDTEILLELITRYGFEETLKRSTGMFAIALWDQQDRRLWIARDRMGEKPLYYGWNNNQWWIASELKAIQSVPNLTLELDEQAIQLYLRRQYIPEPFSIYKGINKLSPGTYAELSLDGDAQVQSYWNFLEIAERGQRNLFPGTEEDAIAAFEHLLKESIKKQRVADVPVGAFLSGGFDSSLVVALMQSLGGETTRTFSIGFEEKDYDESVHAAAVANHLGTNHTELKVTPKDAMSVLPELGGIYDEPFADSSAIPTILVSRLARKQVTVSLSGDAGDELFGGYHRYRTLNRMWKTTQGHGEVQKFFFSTVLKAGGFISRLSGAEEMRIRFDTRQRYLTCRSLQELYYSLITNSCTLDNLLQRKHANPDPLEHIGLDTPFSYAMAVDSVGYLPGDILTKVDRAAMSCSLETRIPLLDHHIIEWAWTLPEQYKVDENQSKKMIRSLLYRYVPQQLLDRPKMGFGVPFGEWIRGPLRDWAESLVSKEALMKTGILDVAATRRLWMNHRDNRVNDQYRVWMILMLQDWLIKNAGS